MQLHVELAIFVCEILPELGFLFWDAETLENVRISYLRKIVLPLLLNTLAPLSKKHLLLPPSHATRKT